MPAARHRVRGDVAAVVAAALADGVANASTAETRAEVDEVVAVVTFGAGLEVEATEAAATVEGSEAPHHEKVFLRVAEVAAEDEDGSEAGGASDAGAFVVPGVCAAHGGPWARCCRRPSWLEADASVEAGDRTVGVAL